MSIALYRKYRPQFFSEIVGQEHIKTTLQNEIMQKRLAQAYLFCGPRGVSKTTMARVFVKAINCISNKKTNSEPCGKCRECENMRLGKSMDCIEIDAASHTGVDNVRENIIENSRISPVQARYKVFVIDEVHMLSISAFNALLKILEEPPEHVIFILATTEAHKVPATIISRCQRFDFKKIEHEVMVKRLLKLCNKENISVEKEVLRSIARLSLGHQRDAESMLSQIMTLDHDASITLKEAELILPKSYMTLVWKFVQNLENDSFANLQLIDKMIHNGIDCRQFCKECVEFFRQLILIKTSKKVDKTCGLDLDQISFKEVVQYLGTMQLRDILFCIELFIETEQLLKKDNFIVQLPLELAVIKYAEYKKQDSKIPPAKKNNAVKDEKRETLLQQTITKNDIPDKEAPPENKEPIKKPSEAVAEQTISSIEIDEIHKHWPEIMKKIQNANHSLAVSMKTGKIKDIQNNTLTMTVGYKFHADFLTKDQNRIIIENILNEITKAHIRLFCEVDESLRSQENELSEEKQQEIEDALDVFGGEVVS